MIRSVTVTNPKGESLTMEIYFPQKSGLYIESIDGLGPSHGTISTSDYATRDGAMYIGSRLEVRNLVFTLGMLDTPSVEENRLKVYRYFQVKKPVTVTIVTDQHVVKTEGYVESNEVNVFSERETCTVSVLCTDPYFYDVDPVNHIFGESIPKFEFEFSNESLTDPLLEMSERRVDTQCLIYYPGDGDTGLNMTMQMLTNASSVELYHISENEAMYIRSSNLPSGLAKPFLTNDIIEICTIKGQKRVELLRAGKRYNIIHALDKRPDWFQIVPGDNVFAYRVDNGENDRNIVFTLSYNVAYEGV